MALEAKCGICEGGQNWCIICGICVCSSPDDDDDDDDKVVSNGE